MAETEVATVPSFDERLAACARAIAANEEEAARILAERNALWAEGAAAGRDANALGAPFGMQGQSVRWNLKRLAEGATPKAGQGRHRGKAK